MNHAERLAQLRKAQGLDGSKSSVSKSALGPYSTNSDPRLGYQAYNLDQVVVHYYDTYVPLLQLLPREGGQNGVGANWKLVRRLKNVVDVSGVPEGARGQIVQVDQVDRYEPFATLSKDQRVTVEASLASQGLQPDAQASASESLTELFLQHEHKNILNGIRDQAITRPVIVGADATTAGASLAADDYDIVACALSFEAWENYQASGQLPATTTITLADGTQHVYQMGVSQASLADTVTVAGNSIEAAVTNPNLKAAGYAWFIGTTGGSAPALAGVTAVSNFTFTATSASAIVSSAFAADHSANDLTMNGIITQIARTDSGATVVDNGGAGLTPTFSGSIREVDDVFKAMWAADRIVPTYIFVSADGSDYFNQVLLSNGNTGAARIDILRGADGNVEAGVSVATYRSPIPAGQKVAKIVPLADLAPGTILFYCDKVPGATPSTRSPTAVLLAQDYLLEVYAKTRRTHELGLSTIGCVAVRYGAAWGALFNVQTEL